MQCAPELKKKGFRTRKPLTEKTVLKHHLGGTPGAADTMLQNDR
jgi:hypothetical protein